MDPMYDFSMFQHGIHDPNQQLQYYRNIIMFLLGELKTLQEAMCTSCRVKCASSPATGSGSQSFSTPNDSTFELCRRRIGDTIPTLPRIAEMDTFCRIPASSSSSAPVNETTASNTMVEISTEVSTETNDPTFYAQKDDLADTAVDVGFVHSFCHEKALSSVCFSRDGSYLAVAIADGGGGGSIVMYEVERRSKYCELREYASQYGSYKRPRISSLCFSANGRYLAAGDYGNRVIIWDIPNKRIRSIIQVHGNTYRSEVRLSPDGRLVAFCDSMTLLVLNVRDNSRKMASQCRCFDFSPNGRHIATGNRNGGLAILNLRTGKAVWNVPGTHLYRVKFTSDGNRLLCDRGRIELWDLNDAESVLIWKSEHIESYSHAISPDNRLLVCSNELWAVNSGQRQCTLEGHKRRVHSVDFSAAGTYLAMVDFDGVVSLWKYSWA